MTRLWRDLGFRIRLRYVRRVQILSRLTLDTLTRVRFDLPLISDDPSVDQNVHEAVDEFLKGNHADDALSEQPGRFLQWLKSDDESRTILEQYLTSQNWIMEWIHRGTAPDDALNYARAYQSTFDQYVPSSNLKSVRILGKRLHAAHKKATRALSESRARKIDVFSALRQPSTVGWVTFLTPTAIAVYGYLYAWIYFGHFGIDTAMFFSVGDYLAHSLNRVNFLALAVVASAAGVLSVIRDSTALPNVLKRLKRRRLVRRAYIIVGIIGLSLPYHFFMTPHRFFMGLAFLSVVLGLGHRLWDVAIGRHVGNAPFVNWLMGTLLTCGLVVWSYAKSQAHLVEARTPDAFLVETTGRTYSDANYKIVGAVSGFVFLVDDENDVDVVPSRTVTRLFISSRRDGVVNRLRHWGARAISLSRGRGGSE